MVGLVVVSHSAKAAEGICEIAAQMGGADARIEPAGGDGEGGIGTSAPRIREAIEAAAGERGDDVVVLVDLGSAVMNAELAVEMAEETLDCEIRIADAPILEGALNAAVNASGSKATIDSVVDAAEEAREYRKAS
ncbi:dihydroxyacetone kinase phosphoryl donor subunit DhaM [Halegenticoccus tardaugens]|uniref:dihydroxyacetone kinase phosphoryl donor subunit DhaM n=1 Tax=Halegenticoccus tardaugens TaxID=2071624 RepID=UPI00100A67FB|nr:dihydroxyacetone kinase phosphoryl donor subunit DhaM [Halegenticoccus tardaugens]